MAYLGTNDMMKVENEVERGNTRWLEVYRAMAYQIAKEIGAMSVVMSGRVDAIIITGGIAYDKKFVAWIEEMVSFIARKVYPARWKWKPCLEPQVLQGK